RRLQIMTIFAATIILIFPLFAWWYTPSSEPLSLRLILLLIPPILLGATYLFKVEWYGLDEEKITVKRVIGKVELKLSEIDKIEVQPFATNRSLRVAGNGGLFGFNGWFRSQHLGLYRAFVTHSAKTIIIYMGERKVVISPGKPKAFVRDVKSRLKTTNPS
ncbi:MAG: PH domain-containing protein, partial [Chloroflexota bacterium]